MFSIILPQKNDSLFIVLSVIIILKHLSEVLGKVQNNW